MLDVGAPTCRTASSQQHQCGKRFSGKAHAYDGTLSQEDPPRPSKGVRVKEKRLALRSKLCATRVLDAFSSKNDSSNDSKNDSASTRLAWCL